jgi:5-methylcytosine-specific restriction endonuclease McrA
MAHGIICLDCSLIVVEVRNGRCPTCWVTWRKSSTRRDGSQQSVKQPGSRRLTPHRMKSQAIYRTARWKRVREMVMARDGRVCRVCGTTQNLTVHHIVSIVKDESLAYDPANLATVCRRCHGRLDGGKAAANKARSRR